MMKILSGIFAVIGVLLLIIVIIGKLVGHPGIFLGVRLLSLLVLSNTAFLSAILIKIFEKK
jgi:hypothetical protein